MFQSYTTFHSRLVTSDFLVKFKIQNLLVVRFSLKLLHLSIRFCLFNLFFLSVLYDNFIVLCDKALFGEPVRTRFDWISYYELDWLRLNQTFNPSHCMMMTHFLRLDWTGIIFFLNYLLIKLIFRNLFSDSSFIHLHFFL